jgi:hypothetical protein
MNNRYKGKEKKLIHFDKNVDNNFIINSSSLLWAWLRHSSENCFSNEKNWGILQFLTLILTIFYNFLMSVCALALGSFTNDVEQKSRNFKLLSQSCQKKHFSLECHIASQFRPSFQVVAFK